MIFQEQAVFRGQNQDLTRTASVSLLVLVPGTSFHPFYPNMGGRDRYIDRDRFRVRDRHRGIDTNLFSSGPPRPVALDNYGPAIEPVGPGSFSLSYFNEKMIDILDSPMLNWSKGCCFPQTRYNMTMAISWTPLKPLQKVASWAISSVIF